MSWLNHTEVDWRFFEKEMPGCRKAWVEQYGESTEGYSFGVSGSRSKGNKNVSATDRAFHYGTEHPFPKALVHGVRVYCGCRQFRLDGKWHELHVKDK